MQSRKSLHADVSEVEFGIFGTIGLSVTVFIQIVSTLVINILARKVGWGVA